ncbi:SUN-domain-containing protein [Mytilinidion resinicola]|uniref:SUN-domain-containing protein n=1 Tax=Mytilinidion resinicola TaxID=574789 RepID=A0A6A6Z972_9PEZI|nr:SUN-domain-containing protein [Mytilinidion resinicola]KAF2817580.1 SUN-domain-containing protein [Mytilinidion resinicola]
MKLATVVLFATGAMAAAKVHRHRHRHAPPALLNREANPNVVTVVVYMLDGVSISEAEVQEGIKNGTLIWGDDGAPQVASTPAYTPAYTPTPTPSSAAIKVEAYSHYVAPSSVVASSVVAPSAAPAPSAVYSGGDGSEGVDTPFPTGLPCTKFPEGYGAVKNTYMGLGGWIGIQNPGGTAMGATGLGYTDIATIPKGSCEDGSCVKDGMFVSYNCPPGYSKSSWPKMQGATLQSVGGLLCKNGELELADGAIAKTLCVKGTDKVTVKVQNTMSKCSSICKTDYPGTEGETAGVYIAGGETQELFCPNKDEYYFWDGKGTSSQYYVNPAGYEPQDACWWGQPGKPLGNNAPMNIGVGYNPVDGNAYISLFQNLPTNSVDFLDYTVEVTGDTVNGKCKYSNGQYCAGDDCNTGAGCTVS